MLNLLKCKACEVYADWIRQRDAEIARLTDMLAAERAARTLLEERFLRALRVLPPEGAVIQGTSPERVNSRVDWPNEKARLEAELAKGTPEAQQRHLYWAKKQETDAPKIADELKDGTSIQKTQT